MQVEGHDVCANYPERSQSPEFNGCKPRGWTMNTAKVSNPPSLSYGVK